MKTSKKPKILIFIDVHPGHKIPPPPLDLLNLFRDSSPDAVVRYYAILCNLNM